MSGFSSGALKTWTRVQGCWISFRLIIIWGRQVDAVTNRLSAWECLVGGMGLGASGNLFRVLGFKAYK